MRKRSIYLTLVCLAGICVAGEREEKHPTQPVKAFRSVIHAVDPDIDDTLSITVSELPEGMTYTLDEITPNAVDIVLTWSNPIEGTYPIVLVATDNYGLSSDAMNYVLTVFVNHKPTLTVD